MTRDFIDAVAVLWPVLAVCIGGPVVALFLTRNHDRHH